MMFFSADQLVLHAIGDYILQSDWMATEKIKKSSAATAHVITYTLPWLLLTTSWRALAFILVTHFVIDRWRIARYVVWAKNWLAPWQHCHDCGGEDHEAHLKPPVPPWSECSATGYPPDRPVWLTTWLLIIADNLLHVCCNAIAIHWLV